MCGILCYAGKRPALPILLEGLQRLEYRGYDSSGLAIAGNGGVACRKAVGKIRALESELTGTQLRGGVGIGHTRWATHGKPSVENAHPHFDCKEKVFVIHNGIVENHRSLKRELIARGHRFRSETDSEILAHLIEEYYQDDLEEALAQSLRMVQGTYGIGVLSADHPGMILVARQGSPLILGTGDEEVFAASDVCAIVNHTRKVIYLQDDDIAVIHADGYEISNFKTHPILRPRSSGGVGCRCCGETGLSPLYAQGDL